MRPLPLAGLLLVVACSDPAGPAGDYRLEVVAGPGEVSVPGQRYDTIAVRLVGPGGVPATFTPVLWTGDGTIEPLHDSTDWQGVARARWTLPGTAVSSNHFTGPTGEFAITAASPRVAWVRMPTTATVFEATQVESADIYGCAIRAAELWCWGNLVYPLNWASPSAVPRRITLPDGQPVVEVATATQMLCVRLVQRPVQCATRAYNGSFGPVGAMPTVIDIVAAEDFFCGRMASREVLCWDRVGPTALLARPKLSTPARALAGGDGFACAVLDNGQAWCWGRNGLGQLGDGTRSDSDTPRRVAVVPALVNVVASGGGACGITAGGDVWCWGTAAAPGGQAIASRVSLDWVRGPAIALGSVGEGYVFNDGRLRGWQYGAEIALPPSFAQVTVTDVSAQDQMCVRTTTGAAHCSWVLLYGGGDTSPLPSGLVPVPDPGWGR